MGNVSPKATRSIFIGRRYDILGMDAYPVKQNDRRRVKTTMDLAEFETMRHLACKVAPEYYEDPTLGREVSRRLCEDLERVDRRME